MKISAVLIASIVVLAGCATQPIPTSQASDVPITRILAPRLAVRQEGFGEVVVKRDRGIMGSACSCRVFVDGEPVADIRPGEKVVLFLAPGSHIIGSNPNGICAGGLSEVSVTASPAKSAILRIRYGTNGDYAIQPTAL